MALADTLRSCSYADASGDQVKTSGSGGSRSRRHLALCYNSTADLTLIDNWSIELDACKSDAPIWRFLKVLARKQIVGGGHLLRHSRVDGKRRRSRRTMTVMSSSAANISSNHKLATWPEETVAQDEEWLDGWKAVWCNHDGAGRPEIIHKSTS